MISTERDVLVDVGKTSVGVEIDVPRTTVGTILIVSPLLRPTESLLAALLNESGFSTLRVGLNPGTSTPSFGEILEGARTVAQVAAWARRQGDLAHMPVGGIGIGTGAAMVLLACEEDPSCLDAVVAIDAETSNMHCVLERVESPTLFIAAEKTRSEVDQAWEALASIPCDASVKVMAGCESVTSSREAAEQAAADSALWFRDQFDCA